MKRRLPVTQRDLTGLACAVGMALLVLLAWATLPRQLDSDDRREDDSATQLGSPFAASGVDAASPADAVPEPSPHGPRS